MISKTSKKVVRRVLRNRMGVIGGLIILALVLCAIFANVISPFSPFAQDMDKRLKPPELQISKSTHILGTDQFGRDILSRLLYGSRVSLITGVGAVLVSAIFGLLLGLVAGYFGGVAEDIIMRLADIQLSFPRILFAILMVAITGVSLLKIIFIIAATSWVSYARVVRSLALTVRELEFVQASRAIGAGSVWIMLNHVLPNVLSPVLVICCVEVGRVIILEASLGFFGLSIQPPNPTWGNMIADGQEYMYQGWWIFTFPGLAMILTVLGVNFFGDSLRDILDPKSERNI